MPAPLPPSVVRRPSSERGFTLIELMVVVAIIALVSATALPTVTSYFKVSLNSTSREIATMIKETYNATIITGNVHRIVYDFKDRKFWVEMGPATALLETKESREKAERRKRYQKEEDKAKDAATSEFTMAKRVTRKKQSLPTGVDFEDIETQAGTAPITEGVAYTHFFPNGMTEQTIVHLKDTSAHHASLVISTLLGRTDVYDRRITVKEVGEQ